MSTVMMSLMPQAAATSRAPTTPAAGPGQCRQRRRAPDGGAARDAAVGLHVEQRRLDLLLGQAIFQPRHVGRHAGHHQRVQHRRQRRARTSRTTGSTSDEAVTAMSGQRRAQGSFGHAPLVHRVGEGVQQADGHRLDLLGRAGLGGGVHARFVRAPRRPRRRRRCVRAPRARARPARDAAASPRRDSWRAAGCPGGRSPAHGGNRPSSPGRCARPCPPGSCWWRRSCRAARGLSVVAARPASSSASSTPARKAWLGSAGMLGVLALPDLAALGVVQGDVGESAADIDGDGERCSAKAVGHRRARWNALVSARLARSLPVAALSTAPSTSATP